MFSKKDIKNIVTRFKQSLLKQGMKVEHLWLFRSYAKGDPHAYSDIDIAVFSSSFSENPFANTRFLQNTGRVPQMQVHLFTMEDFSDNPFVQEIARDAVSF